MLYLGLETTCPTKRFGCARIKRATRAVVMRLFHTYTSHEGMLPIKNHSVYARKIISCEQNIETNWFLPISC